jgi:hypothetical protein
VNAIDALVSGLIDYAGLFPPASEDMRKALEHYASYREGRDRSALGRFIVPVSRLKELEDAGTDLMPRGPGSDPWRLSALVAEDIRAAGEEMLKFNCHHWSDSKVGHALIDVVELKASTVEEVEQRRSKIPAFFTPYFEIPLKGDVRPLVHAIAQAGARAKVRTGGVTPESIPPATAIIDFIVACRSERVPFKATAGLHHPIRGPYRLTYERDSAVGTMYGFVNVFVAAALIYAGVSESTAIAALEESDPHAFVFKNDAILWRDKRITSGQIEAARQEFAVSFGSCSFREPIDDLTPLIHQPRTDDR